MENVLDIPSVPHLVHIETTYACNGNCVFCYNPRRGERFNKEKIDKIVESVHGSWVPHVYLIGGEPSLLGVEQSNAYIDILSQRSSVTIVTNGLICLKGISSDLACIGVPFHGIGEIHEAHSRVPGGFKKTRKSVEYYVKSGFDVRCIPVLTAWNFDKMYEIIRLAKELGMESVFVDRFEDGGIGSTRSAELKPTTEQFKTALSQMISARDDFHIPVGFGTAIPYCLDERLITENMAANCGAGITFAAVNPDGNVRTCNQSEIYYGNVLEEPIERIWRKKELDQFRDLSWVTKPCISCPVLENCLCGCKVDCNFSSEYSVDYSVRGKENPICSVQPIARESSSVNFPARLRKFKLDRFAKINVFHPEHYLITRYQTIKINVQAESILAAVMNGILDERILIESFSTEVDLDEIRAFLADLSAVGAIIFEEDYYGKD